MVMVDQIAASRGKWVSEVLELSPEELSYEVVAISQRAATVGQYVERMAASKSMMVPTLDVALMALAQELRQ